MRRLLRNTSLAAQLIFVSAISLVLVAGSALLVAPRSAQDRMMLGLIGASLVALGFVMALARRMVRPLRQLRSDMSGVLSGRLDPASPSADAAGSPAPVCRELCDLREVFDRMVGHLAGRARTVDRLLEFSQTAQGAGQSDQIYAALTHFLRSELNLAGLVIVTHDAAALPPMQLRACWPDNIIRADAPISELDPSLCPCLRQGLAKEFRPDNSPIRCAIDRSLNLLPSLPAYCIPFHLARRYQGTVHMILPADQQWTDQSKHLAQTYVNAATGSLMTLQLLAEAEQQSLTDSLTGLYNRHSMERLLQREVALAERHGHAMSMVMIDMDKFKQVNDLHGHAAGDHLLRAFADCVRMTLRKTDLAFRYGGDEFLIVLPQTPLAQAQQVVAKLRQAFAAVDFSHAIARLDRQPTLSIGVVERCKSANLLTLPSLLTAADQALYDAKAANRNCVKVYNPTAA